MTFRNVSEFANTLVIMTIEEWRTVPEHPDYDVSNLGSVRSRKRSSVPQLLTNKPHRRLGYCFVRLDGKSYGVHQLVAAVWNGPCPDGLEVDHINYVRNDNRPENLRYVTREQNLIDRRTYMVAECAQGHPMSGDNLYIRPSTGRRECRACTRGRSKKLRSTDRECALPGCSRPAFCRLRTDSPICEMHYLRERRARKRIGGA
jgi:hypothetical protein